MEASIRDLPLKWWFKDENCRKRSSVILPKVFCAWFVFLGFFFFCAAQTTNQLRGKHGGRRRSNKKADLSVRPHPAHKDVQRDARPAHTTTTNYTTLRWASNVLQCFCTSHLLSQLSCSSKMLISKHILYDVQIISPFSYYSVCVFQTLHPYLSSLMSPHLTSFLLNFPLKAYADGSQQQR